MDLATVSIVALVVLAIFFIGFIAVPWLSKKGYLKKDSTKTTEQILQVVGIILKNLNINKDAKDQATLIFNICEKVVAYIDQTSEHDSNEEKKAFAVTCVNDILVQLKIDVNDDVKKLIEIGIEAAVNAVR